MDQSVRQVATTTGLSAHTLRYYERIGLLPRVGRALNGHRRYSDEDLEWIDFLVCLRQTGMPIRDMKEYVDLARAGDLTGPARLALLKSHRKAVQARIESLRLRLSMLDEKIASYQAGIRAWMESHVEERGATPEGVIR